MEGERDAFPNSGRPLSETELKSLIDTEIRDALGWLGSKVSSDRRQAIEYYYGLPYGNERPGRSQVTTRDVLDTIEWIKPTLLRIFTSGDETVKFEPQRQGDEAIAEQATDYSNWIFQRDNPGFLILYQWMTDALLERYGVVKAYWYESFDEPETFLGLSEDELSDLVEDEDVEVLQHSHAPLQMPHPAGGGIQVNLGELHDVTIRRKKAQVKIENVPPEEFLIARDARTIEDARFLAHRTRKTASELVEMGFTRKLVDNLPYAGMDAELNQERLARYSIDQTAAFTPVDRIGANRTIWVTDCYMKVDVDGDGVAELRHLMVAGNNATTILVNEPATHHPFCGMTPIIIPHKVFGLSIADLLMDIQLIRSAFLRQILDNTYNVNNGRWFVKGDVNVRDFQDSVPGGVVRGGMNGVVEPIAPPPFGQMVMEVLEFLTNEGEQRTGVSRYNQGQDANITKTAAGISQLMSAGNAKVELIARIFAETGVKDLFKTILRLVSENQQKSRMIRLRGDWVPMDPQEWNTQFDISINVGLGTGSREYVAAQAMQVLNIQERVAGAGLTNIVQPENVYKALKAWVSNIGWRGDGGFFNDPDQMAPPPPPPNPALLKIQAEERYEMMKLYQHGMIEAAKLQLEREKMLLDHHKSMTAEHLKAGKEPPAPPILPPGLGPSPAPMGIPEQGSQYGPPPPEPPAPAATA